MSNSNIVCTEDNKTAITMQDAWLAGNDKDCERIAKTLAKYCDCNEHKLYTALTNLSILAEHIQER